MTGTWLLTNIERLESIRDGAGEIQEQHICSAVIKQEFGALQHRPHI